MHKSQVLALAFALHSSYFSLISVLVCFKHLLSHRRLCFNRVALAFTFFLLIQCLSQFLYSSFSIPACRSQPCSLLTGNPVTVNFSPILLCIVTLVKNKCLPTVKPLIFGNLSSNSIWLVIEMRKHTLWFVTKIVPRHTSHAFPNTGSQ